MADGFEHFATEWDWMMFFWNLYVDDANGFTIPEIADVFDQVPFATGYAYYCCNSDSSPTLCLPDMDGECPLPMAPEAVTVGKLWEDDATFGVTDSVRERAAIIYGGNPNKYNLFNNTGMNARVNY